MLLGKLRIVGGLVLAASCAVACVVEDDPPPPRPLAGYVGGTPAAGSSGASGSGSSSGASGSGPSSASPILVDVDTDKTMNAAPGQGVGVFVEYATGGHWHVWWTCDTNVNPQGPLTCDFDVQASVATDKVTLTKADTPDGGAQTTPQSVEARTTTGSQVHGLWFDTTAGAEISVQATIGGQLDGRYFFFVQNGKVNGGYTGTLTDPVMFEGNAP
jgi:hypothetical protein